MLRIDEREGDRYEIVVGSFGLTLVVVGCFVVLENENGFDSHLRFDGFSSKIRMQCVWVGSLAVLDELFKCRMSRFRIFSAPNPDDQSEIGHHVKNKTTIESSTVQSPYQA